MSGVAIDRFKVRYRMLRGDVRVQSRLQRVVLAAVEQLVEDALDRAGIGRDELVCIRDLQSVVRLRLREPDSMLMAAFGESLARDIAAAARRSSASTVIYASRAHAVVDLATAAASGDASRSWAWNQVGIWSESEPASADAIVRAVVRALMGEPRNAVAIVAYLARCRRSAFDALVDRAPAHAWIEIARAAAAAAGAPSGWLEERPGEGDLLSHAEPSDGPATEERLRLIVARCVRTSAIGNALLARRVAGRGAPPGTISTADARRHTALAALSILEVEPASMSTDVGELRRTLAIAERDLRERASSGAAVPSPADERSTGQPETPRDPSSDSTIDVVDDVRRRGSTEYGGVLFLLNVAETIGWPARLENDPRLMKRGLRWTLHQIAVLLGGDPADAAVLAFAGLLPDQPPPSAAQPPPDATELETLREHRRTLLGAVRERLGRPDEPDEELIRFVCVRRASILADPGWIELRLPAEEVSIDVRRCGLDRDPGWVPWLGVVVRFRYV